jgi:hypothetical protein
MAPCNPPLNFVANGAAGSAFPPPLDPTPPSFGPPSPTFEESACSLLGPDLCGGMDPISAIDELSGLVDSIDALTTAADSQLDAILLELDQLGQDKVENAFNDFAGAQPGAMSLIGDVTGVTLPALGEIPISSPTGQAIVTPGAPPSGGGIAPAGAAPYVLHHPIPFNFDPERLVGPAQLSGPNPPFVKLNGFTQDTPAAGGRGWAAEIEINPAHAGTYQATLSYSLAVTLTGINTIIKYSEGVTVVVQ